MGANVDRTHSQLNAAFAVWLEECFDRPLQFKYVSTDEICGSPGPKDPAFSVTTHSAPYSP